MLNLRRIMREGRRKFIRIRIAPLFLFVKDTRVSSYTLLAGNAWQTSLKRLKLGNYLLLPPPPREIL